ncbi:hypothetical protein QAD02_006796 [Eretmocerus hayati]|uniref:Uncharacterized protein n=1 Tax=Eretmocerus hayati TaxID=131215 RepID=A0ACC2N497_9HYME|nr:hypothetical protein QAD02_006796 [Eretmocerus hayati]
MWLTIGLNQLVDNNDYSSTRVERIIYRDKVALLKLAEPLPKETKVIDLVNPVSAVKMLKSAVALTAGKFPVNFDKILRRPSVNLQIVPNTYCGSTPIKNSSQICLRAYPNRYCAPILGGPIMFEGRQLAIVARGDDLHDSSEKCSTLEDGYANYYTWREYSNYPSIIGYYDWIVSGIQTLAENRKINDTRDYEIHVHP